AGGVALVLAHEAEQVDFVVDIDDRAVAIDRVEGVAPAALGVAAWKAAEPGDPEPRVDGPPVGERPIPVDAAVGPRQRVDEGTRPHLGQYGHLGAGSRGLAERGEAG